MKEMPVLEYGVYYHLHPEKVREDWLEYGVILRYNSHYIPQSLVYKRKIFIYSKDRNPIEDLQILFDHWNKMLPNHWHYERIDE